MTLTPVKNLPAEIDRTLHLTSGSPSFNAWIKAVAIFLIAFALYHFTQSPGLDEIDSVNFAMGVRHFNIWEHQPHPPGYPLYIFLGKVGQRLFAATPEDALHFVSALGGAAFVSLWFLIVLIQFNERFAWWLTGCLLITPAVWMTSTKVLTDSPAAAFVSAEILAALFFIKGGRSRALAATALSGAAAAGMRPQLFLVVLLILVTALRIRRTKTKGVMGGVGLLIGGCLLWLLPMWYSQWRLKPDTSALTVYPHLVYVMWSGRLHNPGVYLGAGDWSARYLSGRLASHLLGWFGLGLGFLQSWTALVTGALLSFVSLGRYLFGRHFRSDRHFWKLHAPWALLHCLTIFICLPSAQRYYLIIFPLLLVAILGGLQSLRPPWNYSTWALPALLLFSAIPVAITNHRDDTPPLSLVKFLEALYPPDQRSRVALLFTSRTRRHAEWYAPGFVTFRQLPATADLPKILEQSDAVYTDDPGMELPVGWYRVPFVQYMRSPVVYWKGHSVELYLVVRPTRP